MPANNVLETWAELLLGVSSTLERGRRDRIGACGACVCVCVFFLLPQLHSMFAQAGEPVHQLLLMATEKHLF